jgi:D-glycero-alpha-D-manno-heptose-7-phosphate kinase
MLITQTPLRVSFLGGGTDYPAYFLKHGGAVLGTAVDKYAYLSIAHFYSELFDYSIRVSYRQVECAHTLEEIKHAPFRECLRWCNQLKDLEVNYTAELPANTGLGSSSTFVVGLLNTLYAFQGRFASPMELAIQAIKLEREVLQESVGCQDQTFAAFGGFNVIEFRGLEDIRVQRLPLSPERMQEFESHLLVFFTGLKRSAEQMAASQVSNIDRNLEMLHAMRRMVDEGYDLLVNTATSLSKFGELLHKTWELKKALAEGISNPTINEIYEAGIGAGAFGGKLLGAGNGGFILFFAPPEKHAAIKARLSHLTSIPLRINAPGSRIIHA